MSLGGREEFGLCDYLSDICASLMEEKCLAESQRLSLQKTCAKNHILELQGNHSEFNRKQKMKKVFHFTVHLKSSEENKEERY